MLFCCSQNKNNIRRRFFERFQQSIKCSGRKHMNLIDNIYFITSLNRGILYLFPNIPDILHTVIRSRIDFEYIKRTLCVNCLTGRTGITGVSIDRMLTVYRLCKKLCNRSLTSTSCTTKKIGMPYSVINNLISQCLDNGILSSYFIKIIRTPLPV